MFLLCYLFVSDCLVFGFMFIDRVVFFSWIARCVLYSAGSSVKKSACCFVYIANEVVYLCPCLYFM